MTRKGKSHSRRPVSRRAPAWCRYSPEEVETFVINLAKEEVPISMIGVILRDKYGIPLVKPIVDKSIQKIVKEAGLKNGIPEDLDNLTTKAKRLQQHLAKNKADGLTKRSLQQIESKMRRLAKYYKKRGLLPKEWKFQHKLTYTS